MRSLTISLLLGLLVIGASAPRAEDADTLLQTLSQRLVLQQALRGDFTQRKQLEFMDRPFESSGSFALDTNGELRWQLSEPVASLMLVQGSRVTLDGEPMRDHGVGRLMAMIMRGFMEGKLAALQRYFQISGDVGQQPWQLRLVPQSSRLLQVIKHIDLTGDSYLQSIHIAESSGASTSIEFRSVGPASSGDATSAKDPNAPEPGA